MLTENDIKRIHTEEQLRHEIRKQLDAAHAAQTAPATPVAPPKNLVLAKKRWSF